MNDYDKYTQGNLPAETPQQNATGDKWYNSFFNAAGTVGSAYFNSIAPGQQAQAEAEKRKTRTTIAVMVLALIIIAFIIYKASKK